MNLKYGSQGPNVSTLQESLNKLGANPPLVVDGDFGSKTLAAVHAFQNTHGLVDDGIVGPNTQAAIQNALSGGGPIIVPTGFSYLVDLYHGDSISDINKFGASNFCGAIHKASEGNSVIDRAYLFRRDAIKGVGKLFGAYMYIHPNESAKSQTDNFIKMVGSIADDELPPSIDWEEEDGVSNAGMNDVVAEIDAILRKELGRVPQIYGSWGQLSGYGVRPQFVANPLWVADIRGGTTSPRIPSPWNTYKLWQYSFTADVPGIGNPCDVNKVQGSIDDLKAYIAASKI